MISDSGRGEKYRSSHLTEPEESDGESKEREKQKRMRVLEDKKRRRSERGFKRSEERESVGLRERCLDY